MAFSPNHAYFSHYLVIIIGFVGRYDKQCQPINVSVIQFYILMKVIMTKIWIRFHFQISGAHTLHLDLSTRERTDVSKKVWRHNVFDVTRRVLKATKLSCMATKLSCLVIKIFNTISRNCHSPLLRKRWASRHKKYLNTMVWLVSMRDRNERGTRGLKHYIWISLYSKVRG